MNVERAGQPLTLTLEMPSTPHTNRTASIRSASVAAKDSTPPTSNTAVDGVGRAWQELGIRVIELSDGERRKLPERYNGGVKILFVRSGSRGARYGLRNGDILVGLDGYETLGEANLKFVLGADRLKDMNQLSFQIVRNGNRALMGKIDMTTPGIAGQPSPHRGVSATR